MSGFDARAQYVTWAVLLVVVLAGAMIGITIALRTPPLEDGGSPPDLVLPPDEEIHLQTKRDVSEDKGGWKDKEKKNFDSESGWYRYAGVTTETDVCSPIATAVLSEYGGSAVDAMISAALCAGVINHHSSGLGGGHFATIYDTPRGEDEKVLVTIISREKAPILAHRDMFVNNTEASRDGGLAIGVPGEVAGLYTAWQMFGRLDWGLLFEPAISLCEEGFTVGSPLAGAVRSYESTIRGDANLREIFVKEDGSLVAEGDTIVNVKLGQTLRRIAADPHTFYTGSLAQDIVADIQEYDGIVTLADLRNYTSKVKEPLSVSLENGDYTLYAPRPPASGAVLAFILNILDGYNFSPASVSTTDSSVLTYHRFLEAFKFAYAKRSQLGDEDFEDVRDLLFNLTSDDYAADIRRQVNDSYTQDVDYYGPTFDIEETPGTAHLNVLAPDGAAVALTSTINLFFGSNVRGSRTGIMFNNEMDDFSTPGTSNSFGVPASPANYIVPGKMPMSSMAPVIITDRDHNVRLMSGAAGGTRITTQTAFVTAGKMWLGRSVKESTDTGRLHHQLVPNWLVAEPHLDQDILDGLRDKAHEVTRSNSIATVGTIARDCPVRTKFTANSLKTPCIEAVCDGRKGGYPDGV